jgi:hypothetical protein
MDDPHVTVSISPGSKKQSLAKLRDLGPQEIFPRTPKQKGIEQLVSGFMQYLSNDLKARHPARHPANVPSQEAEPPLHLPRARHIEELGWQLPERKSEPISDFVEKLEALVTTSSMMSHADTIGFLLGAIFHCGPLLPTLPGDCDSLVQSTSRTRRAWYGRASLVCAVVDGILPSWSGRAYVLFHPLAGEPHFLWSDISNGS